MPCSCIPWESRNFPQRLPSHDTAGTSGVLIRPPYSCTFGEEHWPKVILQAHWPFPLVTLPTFQRLPLEKSFDFCDRRPFCRQRSSQTSLSSHGERRCDRPRLHSLDLHLLMWRRFAFNIARPPHDVCVCGCVCLLRYSHLALPCRCGFNDKHLAAQKPKLAVCFLLRMECWPTSSACEDKVSVRSYSCWIELSRHMGGKVKIPVLQTSDTIGFKATS